MSSIYNRKGALMQSQQHKKDLINENTNPWTMTTPVDMPACMEEITQYPISKKLQMIRDLKERENQYSLGMSPLIVI